MQTIRPQGLRFAILQKTIRRQMDEYVRETGLTGTQVGVLGELGRLERESAGEVTQKALEAAAHVTHPTMTELLKKLEKKGLCHLPHQRKRTTAARSSPPPRGRTSCIMPSVFSTIACSRRSAAD